MTTEVFDHKNLKSQLKVTVCCLIRRNIHTRNENYTELSEGLPEETEDGSEAEMPTQMQRQFCALYRSATAAPLAKFLNF